MVGSVFSPWYASARARDPQADPLDFPAFNLAIYDLQGRGGSRWVMSEYRRDQCTRSAQALRIGGNTIRWEGDSLVIDVDDRVAPIGGRVRGQVRVTPTFVSPDAHVLDAAGHHNWWCVAPRSDVQAMFSAPDLQFSGHGYHDSNWGREPLERGFRRWNWSRADHGEGAVLIYDVEDRSGQAQTRAWRINAARREAIELPHRVELASARYGMHRSTRADRDADVQLERVLEDTPFYTRNVLQTQLLGERTVAMHESLDLDRFSRPLTQWMIPFRSRRR